jgi:hypothetical protein
MAFKVIAESKSVNLIEQIGTRNDRATGNPRPVYRSNHWLADGTLIPDEKIAPFIIEKYDAGDPHLRSLIERVDEETEKPKKVAKKATKTQPAKK